MDQQCPDKTGEFTAILKDAETYRTTQLRDRIVSSLYQRAEEVSQQVVTKQARGQNWDELLDNVLTSRWFGFPMMLGILALVFWLTLSGANYPSQLLATGLFWGQDQLTLLFQWLGAPDWLHGVLVLGMYRSMAWVVSVMLPPMAIFFPCFTLLEDLGYLPRVAFNLDRFFKKAGTHGKQALTMSMGLGCNAAGVVACRIIDSPRERLIAIITNNFVPCNGRFPTLMALATIFLAVAFPPGFRSIAASSIVVGMILLGATVTLITSLVLSKTVLKGVPSTFALELPPYRKPQLGRVIVTSMLDRTIFVLGRAISIAAPAGAIIWILANIHIGDLSMLTYIGNFLDPAGKLLGMDGFILLAFMLGLPANEIVFPILIMSYLATGSLTEFESLATLHNVLVSHGWTWVTGLNVMIFSLLHFPCATTLLTIRKETNSWSWTAVSALLPTAIGIVLTLMIAQIARLFY